ncbi:hypothetical protein EJ06DRAFT_256164 [Trichodelitschia bisporula]|uniref:Uncharacterized protein n=1 Tax=Trichodelitschia bisporula TaxID=703511 RepID=A0A6G1HIZ9_9PEZI|nr:hypothetical protein EJ06DRAFT_256164 [Trichodelitschia bisporula]
MESCVRCLSAGRPKTLIELAAVSSSPAPAAVWLSGFALFFSSQPAASAWLPIKVGLHISFCSQTTAFACSFSEARLSTSFLQCSARAFAIYRNKSNRHVAVDSVVVYSRPGTGVVAVTSSDARATDRAAGVAAETSAAAGASGCTTGATCGAIRATAG